MSKKKVRTSALLRMISRLGPSSVSSFSYSPRRVGEVGDAGGLRLVAVLVDEGAGVVELAGGIGDPLQPRQRLVLLQRLGQRRPDPELEQDQRRQESKHQTRHRALDSSVETVRT